MPVQSPLVAYIASEYDYFRSVALQRLRDKRLFDIDPEEILHQLILAAILQHEASFDATNRGARTFVITKIGWAIANTVRSRSGRTRVEFTDAFIPSDDGSWVVDDTRDTSEVVRLLQDCCWSRLSEDEREVLEMLFFKAMDAPFVAANLNVDRTTVARRRKSAITRLQIHLRQEHAGLWSAFEEWKGATHERD